MSKPPREPEELTNWREFVKEAGRKEAASFKGCDVVEFGFLEAYDRSLVEKNYREKLNENII